MKDEYQVRVEALKLTQMVGGISSARARTEIADTFEHYILNGYAGEAKPTAQVVEMVPGTEGKDPPKRRTKRASEVPASSGEASDSDSEGETDLALAGRPSSRVGGLSV